MMKDIKFFTYKPEVAFDGDYYTKEKNKQGMEYYYGYTQREIISEIETIKELEERNIC